MGIRLAGESSGVGRARGSQAGGSRAGGVRRRVRGSRAGGSWAETERAGVGRRRGSVERSERFRLEGVGRAEAE